MPDTRSVVDRILNLTDTGHPSGCWQWTSSNRTNGGYGRIKVQGKTRVAHRVLYEAVVGPVPQGLELDHLCRNPGCVNPEHLEPVTHGENLRRRPKKTHCKNGHEYDEANSRVRANGRRDCRACDRQHTAKYLARRKALA